MRDVIEEGTGNDLADVIPDLPRDGKLPDGRPWPPQPGAQSWSALWRRLADMVSRIDSDGSRHPAA